MLVESLAELELVAVDEDEEVELVFELRVCNSSARSVAEDALV
jgi:hypothetical protein